MKIRLTVSIPEEQIYWLESESNKTGATKAGIIRRIVANAMVQPSDAMMNIEAEATRSRIISDMVDQINKSMALLKQSTAPSTTPISPTPPHQKPVPLTRAEQEARGVNPDREQDHEWIAEQKIYYAARMAAEAKQAAEAMIAQPREPRYHDDGEEMTAREIEMDEEMEASDAAMAAEWHAENDARRALLSPEERAEEDRRNREF